MIASAGIALLAAIVVKIAATYLRDRRLAFKYMKTYAAVLLVGIVAQGLWAHRKPAPLEWSLPGYPRPYLQQLFLKSGNEPELGYATWRDVGARIKTNLQDETAMFVGLFSSHWINVAWWSVVIAGPLFLILLGWGYSVWRARGDALQEWFFAGYQFIYVLWPWKMEVRFFLPAVPLACLYLWKGIQALGVLVKSRPVLLGIIWMPISVILAAKSIVWLWHDPLVVHITKSGLQQEVSLAAWLLSGIVAAWLVRRGSKWPAPLASLLERQRQKIAPFDIDPKRSLKFGCTLAIAGLAVAGLTNDLQIGRQNRDDNSAVNRVGPDVKAAMWIRLHTDSLDVITARHVPLVFHYSQRKVIWFAPIVRPQVMMEGFRRLGVRYVIVIDRDYSYYLPPDEVCFEMVQRAYPDAFHLVAQLGQARIYKVIPEGVQ
jgi:hypothetical protein